eukprot:XP_015574040.1 uncharacterized protein LOC107261174 [Ricinus communis]
MVDRLKLPTTKHPKPYILQWLNDSGGIKEFEDLFPDEIPNGLPPIRGIEHQIDFVPGRFVVVYFDDILIYSRSYDEHAKHVRLVLETLRKEVLFANLKKCNFCTNKLVFLGFVVNAKGIKVDEEKVKAIKDWPIPTNASEVQSFHGLASFYRSFVKDFSTITAPLNELVKKDVKFNWGEAQQSAFDLLKQRLTFSPILSLPNFDKTFEIDTLLAAQRVRDPYRS